MHSSGDTVLRVVSGEAGTARSAPVATEPGMTELGSAMVTAFATINSYRGGVAAGRPGSATMREVLCKTKLSEQIQILEIQLMNLN